MLNTHLEILRDPFNYELYFEKAPLDRELILLRNAPCNNTMRNHLLEEGYLAFYRMLDATTYLELKNLSLSVSSMFSSTYRFESMFSRMNIIIKSYRSRVSDRNLEAVLRVETITRDYEYLFRN